MSGDDGIELRLLLIPDAKSSGDISPNEVSDVGGSVGDCNSERFGDFEFDSLKGESLSNNVYPSKMGEKLLETCKTEVLNDRKMSGFWMVQVGLGGIPSIAGDDKLPSSEKISFSVDSGEFGMLVLQLSFFKGSN